ncbi:MAG: hypothetical protein IJW39_01050, partial [Opitutales bacterium]|nr:hypothetical protein [Opitutales bacterium]
LKRLTAFGTLDLGMGDWTPTRSKTEEPVSVGKGMSVLPKIEVSALTGGGNSIAADSLARVGGILGGVQSPAILASKQTAKNTAQANKYLRKIANAQTVAVFA